VKKYLILTLISISSFLSAQSESAFLASFKAGDTQALETYLTDNIDFCLFEDQQILAKKVAMTKLKTFLSGHKVSSIEVIHKGTSKDKTSQYKVAKVVTSKETFRLFVYGTGDFKAGTVKEIRIDKF
jgi:hypothetical protein